MKTLASFAGLGQQEAGVAARVRGCQAGLLVIKVNKGGRRATS